MPWTIADIPEQTGRTAVVTGANGGLGLETAKALAGAGAHVVMAARDQEKAAAARDQIHAAHPDASLELVALDLAVQASVKEAAEKILAGHDRIDLLVNNAGVMGLPRRTTEDGFEMQLAVNHLGHWTFTALLLPAIVAADAARVVTVTSAAFLAGRRVDAADPHLSRRYGPWKAYGQSKLANLHFGIGLQRGFEEAAVRAQSLVAHPGYANTDLQAHSVRETGGLSQRFFRFGVKLVGAEPSDGALPQLRAATDPAAKGGELYGPRWVVSGPPVRQPSLQLIGLEKSIRTLWKVSEQETGVGLDVTA